MSDKIRILVVDHNPDVLLATSRLLKEAGFEVLEASSGEKTLQAAKEDPPDLVLLEVVLPDMDGTEVCKRMKADPSLRGLLVVLLSGVRISSESQAEGLEGGADGYSLGPYRTGNFWRGLSPWCASSRRKRRCERNTK